MKKLKHFGLSIYDKTEDIFWAERGKGIHRWLTAHGDVIAWVVLDDEVFPDYETYEVSKYLVKTEFLHGRDGGLQEEHIEQVVAILNPDETDIQ